MGRVPGVAEANVSAALPVRVAIAERLVRWTLPAMLVGWALSITVLLNTETPPTRLAASVLWLVSLVAAGVFARRHAWLSASAWLCVGLALVTGSSTVLNGVHSYGFIGNLVLMALVVPLFGARWGIVLVAWVLVTGGAWLWLDALGLSTGVRYPTLAQALIFTAVLAALMLAVLTAPTRMLTQALSDAQERLLALEHARQEERKAADALQRASERLAHAERFEALGKLSGGVAHDFNNMLSAIMGATELIASQYKRGTDPELDANVDMVRDATRRAAELTRKLLAFGRKDRIEARALDLHTLIHEVSALARTSLGGRIKLTIALAPEPLQVLGDRAALEHALLNLLLNARDALPEGGEITVSTRRLVADSAWCQACAFDVTPGEMACIRVADNGTGMEPAVVARIFEPFFTTKPQGHGTGLGLSAVHGTVVSHQGAIEVQSELGKGSCFEVYLPLHVAPTSTAHRETTSPTSPAPEQSAPRA